MFQISDTCMRKLHAMTDDNVYTAPKSGQRYCRECMKIRRNKKRKTPVKPGQVLFPFPHRLWMSWVLTCQISEKNPNQFLLEHLREYCRQHGSNLEDVDKRMQAEVEQQK